MTWSVMSKGATFAGPSVLRDVTITATTTTLDDSTAIAFVDRWVVVVVVAVVVVVHPFTLLG